MTPACPTTGPELVALQTDYDMLNVDFTAICAQLRQATDCLLQVNALLQEPAVAAIMRQRVHEQRVLAAIREVPR